MKTSPHVSVIIPTYNRRGLLRKAVESVLRQTFADYEIIIVDDGSSDGTDELIAKVVEDNPELGRRIHYFFQPNQGKSVALNYGLAEARGEWLAFLDSDDQWLPTKIEDQLRALRQFDPVSGACFTNARYINNPLLDTTAFERAGKEYKGDTGLIQNSPLLQTTSFENNQYWVFMQTIVVHSRVMKMVGEFDPSLWTSEDADFVFRLSLTTDLCFVNSPLVLIDCTPSRSDGLTELRLQSRDKYLELQQQMLAKWLALSEGRGKILRKLIRSELRHLRSKEANRLLINEEYQEAKRWLGMAARAECTVGVATKWCMAMVAPTLARRVVNFRSRNESRIASSGEISVRLPGLTPEVDRTGSCEGADIITGGKVRKKNRLRAP